MPPARRCRLIAIFLLAAIGACLLLPTRADAVSEGAVSRLEASVISTSGDSSSGPAANLLASSGEAFVGGSGAIEAGFAAPPANALTLSLGSSTIALSPVPGASSHSVDSLASVVTDAAGYLLYVEQDRALTHPDNVTTIPAVAGTLATPGAWTEGDTLGLGISVVAGTNVDTKWGAAPDFRYAAVPATRTSLHAARGNGGVADVTTIRLRVGVSASQKPGTYTNVLTFTALPQV